MLKNTLPVFIVTGFLGAGKTSFINQFLLQNPDKRFAIIENEVGNISIDQLLINADENIFEIFNGCVCCSVKNELLDVLDELIRQMHKFDVLLIETTGIADPANIISPFYTDEYQKNFDLYAVITLVDTPDVLEQAQNNEEVQKQIALADVLILNKIDRVETESIENVKLKFTEWNSDALQIDTLFGTYHIHQFRFEKYHTILNPQVFLKKVKLDLPYSAAHAYQTQTIITNGVINLEKFSDWFSYFLNLHRRQILRLKAIIYTDADEKYIVQAVGINFTTTFLEYTSMGEKPENKFVIIGKELDMTAIQADFDYLMETLNP
jgi:G3E family GTPase